MPQNDLLTAVLDSLPFAITSVAPDGTILFVNRAAVDNLSSSRDEIIGVPVFDYFPDLAGATRERIRQTVAARTVQQFEATVTLPDGTVRHFQSAYTPAFDGAGAVVSVQIVAQDVTALRLAEEAKAAADSLWGVVSDDLSMTTERVRALLDNAALIITVHDPDGTIRYINRVLDGMNIDEVIGGSTLSWVTADSRSVLERAYRRLLESHEVTQCEVEGISGKSWLITLAPLEHDGEIKQVLGCTLDVTEQRQLQLQLAQKQKLESLGTMARGIAHDFNNLLTAVMGDTGLARRRLRSGGDVAPLLDEVDAAARRAADLCEQMLVYAGRDQPDAEPSNLNDVIEEMTPLTRAAVSPTIELEYELAPSLPSIRCARAQLGQVVLNLVNNAADAIGERDGRIRIATESVRLAEPSADYLPDPVPPGQYAHLEISDTGPGIDDEMCHLIFDPFYSTKTAGHGLGLSVVLGILASSGAGIRVGSAPGGGASISLLFPSHDEEAPMDERSPDELAWPVGDDALVLVVDDEAAVRRTVVAVLEEAGYRVIDAADGDQALELIAQHAPALRAVLLDVTMPGRDGFSTLAELRKRHRALPVLLSSGRPTELPADDPHVRQLSKPYSVDGLVHAVAEAIGRSETPALEHGRSRAVVAQSADVPEPPQSAHHPPTGRIPVCQLIAERARCSPDSIALIDGELRLSYRDLLGRARSLAHELHTAGAGIGARVGLSCARSADMIVAALGILEAGAAYVPIDPGLPPARAALIVGDAGVELVVTQRRLRSRLSGLDARLIAADEPRPALAAQLAAARPDDPAFVLYTSGSTGEPKGVECLHRSISSRLRWAQSSYPYGPGEVACARTALGFVDSVAEIFAPLAFGVPLVVIDDETQADPWLMIARLGQAQVSRVVLVPSLLATMLEVAPDLDERLPALRYWFVGGEPVAVPLVHRFRERLPGRKLINIYGSTELSGDATYFDFDEMPDGLHSAPIGHALDGCWARVLDDSLTEVEDGEAGEVCVSGVCLARGYVNQPARTAERFVANPFPEGGRLFKTGDLGRRLPGGALQYLGRVDQLVKIRGMRIELGAVEAELHRLPDVIQSVAVAQDHGDQGRRLVAFFTARRPLQVQTLRSALAERLPAAAVPSLLIQLDQLPVTANGKLDRHALTERPVAVGSSARNRAPGSRLQQQVETVWRQVLGIDEIGPDDDFFDLGGTSLDAARIAARLREELGVELSLATLFEQPTVAGVASRLARDRRAGSTPRRGPVASGSPPPTELGLSVFQVPFWLLQRATGEVSQVSEIFGVTGEVDIGALQAAYCRAVSAFDALWMRVSPRRPVQRPARRTQCWLSIADHRLAIDDAEALLDREAAAHATAPFDLARPPHVRGRLLLMPDGGRRLLLTMPHLVADMSAVELFRRALEHDYRHALGIEPAPWRPPAHTASLADLVAFEDQRDPPGDSDDAYWRQLAPRPAWNRFPGQLFANQRAGRRVRAVAARTVDADLEELLVRGCRRRGVSSAAAITGAVAAAIGRRCREPTVDLLMMTDRRHAATTESLFTTLSALLRLRLAWQPGDDSAQLAERASAQLIRSHDRADLLMHRPTWFNDQWTEASPLTRAALRRVAGLLTRRWPTATRDLLAEYLFALAPTPGWLARQRLGRTDHRAVAVCLNIFPEVYRPRSSGQLLVPARRMEQLLEPDDLVVGADPVLGRALQIHLHRDGDGQMVINLYGGGFDPAALSGLADDIADGLATVAGADRAVG